MNFIEENFYMQTNPIRSTVHQYRGFRLCYSPRKYKYLRFPIVPNRLLPKSGIIFLKRIRTSQDKAEEGTALHH